MKHPLYISKNTPFWEGLLSMQSPVPTFNVSYHQTFDMMKNCTNYSLYLEDKMTGVQLLAENRKATYKI